MSYHNDLVSLIKYEWELTGKPDGSDVVVSAYETPKPTLKPDVSGVYTFSLVVNDGINKSNPDEMKINVTTTEQNSLPTIIFPYDFLKSNYDYYIKVDEVTFIYGNEAVDLDGDTLSYSYRLIQTPSNSEITEINGAEGNLYIDYFIPDVAGVYKIGATASDGKNTSEESVATIYVTDASTNSKPVVFAKPDKELSSCSFNIEISNGYDGDLGYNPDGLNYRWFTISKPQDSTITYSTQQNYTTDILVDKSGDYVFGVVVNDGMIDSNPSTLAVDVTCESVEDVITDTQALTIENKVVGAWVGSVECSGNNFEFGFFLCPQGRLRGYEKINGLNFIDCGTWKMSDKSFNGLDDSRVIELNYKYTAAADSTVTGNQILEFYMLDNNTTMAWLSACNNPYLYMQRLEGGIEESDCTTGTCSAGGSGAISCTTDCQCGECWYCENGECKYGGEGPYGCYRGCGL